MYGTILGFFAKPVVKIIAVVVVVGLLVSAGMYVYNRIYQSGYSAAEIAGQLKLEKYKEHIRTQFEAQLKAQKEYDESVAARIELFEKDKENAIKDLNDRHARIVDSLRNRGTRATAGSRQSKDSAYGTADSTRAGCTGGELFREDGEFLAREAARAETLKKSLESCRAKYNALLEKK